MVVGHSKKRLIVGQYKPFIRQMENWETGFCYDVKEDQCLADHGYQPLAYFRKHGFVMMPMKINVWLTMVTSHQLTFCF